MLKIAIVQHQPEFLNLEGSLKKAGALIRKAAANGSRLVVFGESWFSGYPAWLDHFPGTSLWDHEPTKDTFAAMHRNSLSVASEEFSYLKELAATNQIYLAFGFNEKIESGRGNGSIYNALAILGPDGEVCNHHRKLMPTFSEKLVYALGDGHGLQSVGIPGGRMGGLICWEHWMPHARQALHDSGETIHIALWPSVHEVHQLASRHYAFEGRCFVVAVGQILTLDAMPPVLVTEEFQTHSRNDFLLNGGSCVIDPRGSFIAEPIFNEETIIYAEIDSEVALREKITLDTSGHYARPDVFTFQVNHARMT
jgi:predicted amidohydrolase